MDLAPAVSSSLRGSGVGGGGWDGCAEPWGAAAEAQKLRQRQLWCSFCPCLGLRMKHVELRLDKNKSDA